MHNACTQFKENIRRARDLGGLAQAIERVTTNAIDVSDMWRAQLVLGVSALDHFIHEITRMEMIATAQGNRPRTDAFLKFHLPFTAFDQALNGHPYDMWLGEAIREKHSWVSFQHPDKIADAIRLISPIKLWEAVGSQLGMKASEVKVRLELIVDRRNKIAHEADMDPANPGFRWPITMQISKDSLDFIELIAEALAAAVT